ncbi:YfiR family protein [Chryseosolibacter indicus]|uniref:DUF4154 domain-containing protein n=1 Tax=Chryseosolibacter indicus TaxID=2782351 RepID=A0ABS5VP10_9BACT|nr:YfiR family protein [Chryseosolibacter indicus]MBT1701746.1 DUF4154 domain-containing protein [Chryseosolibacter indicus]
MKKSVLLVFFALAATMATAQNHKLHTVFIYSFTRYVIWPDAYNQGDFEILVFGDTPMANALKEMAQSKKVGERSIKITKINSASEIRKCNMVVIPEGKSGILNDVITKVNNQSILIITEEPGMASKGSNINFIERDGKLAFELNQGALTRQNLKVANELSRLAIII